MIHPRTRRGVKNSVICVTRDPRIKHNFIKLQVLPQKQKACNFTWLKESTRREITDRTMFVGSWINHTGILYNCRLLTNLTRIFMCFHVWDKYSILHLIKAHKDSKLNDTQNQELHSECQAIYIGHLYIQTSIQWTPSALPRGEAARTWTCALIRLRRHSNALDGYWIGMGRVYRAILIINLTIEHHGADKLILAQLVMEFATAVPKYFNFATFSEDWLATLTRY
jgi:hypothetical protein